MIILTLKLVLTPLLIAVASLVRHRWSGSLGGLIAGLPLTSAPISAFLALEQGPAFAARSATGTLLGVVAMSGFCAVYVLSAKRLSWPLSTALASAACAAIRVAVSLVPQNLAIAAVLAFPTLPARVFIIGQPASDLPVLPPPWWDTPARMVVAAGAVILITAAAEIIGSTWSGLLATLPVFACVMGVFSHRHGGHRAAHGALRGIAVGALGSAAFFLVVGTLVEHVDLVVSYVVAVVFALGVAGLSYAAFS
jgi:hypothetical protein